MHRVHLIAPLNYTGKDYGMRSFVRVLKAATSARLQYFAVAFSLDLDLVE